MGIEEILMDVEERMEKAISKFARANAATQKDTSNFANVTAATQKDPRIACKPRALN